MAQLDKFLTALTEYRAEALILEQGHVPSFRFLSGTKSVSKQVLDTEAILALVQEVSSADIVNSFHSEGTASFVHAIGPHSYSGILEEDSGSVVATLWETSLELAEAQRDGRIENAAESQAASETDAGDETSFADMQEDLAQVGEHLDLDRARGSERREHVASHGSGTDSGGVATLEAPPETAVEPGAGSTTGEAIDAEDVVRGGGAPDAVDAEPAAPLAVDGDEASRIQLPSLDDHGQDEVIPDDLPAGYREKMDNLLRMMVEKGSSDLHLCCTQHPVIRVDGHVSIVADFPVLDADELYRMLFSVTPQRNREEFLKTRDTDFAYAIEGVSRYRVNLFFDRHGPGAVFRAIPDTILSADQLGLTSEVQELANLHKGLVLVTGPTGSGKSTTLASLIDLVNERRQDHIITIEDPVEFVHPNKQCLVNQREVGVHTRSFKAALRAALREDPDVVLVGELRDLETVEMAIETAETGHLVFGTLHTTTASSTVDRLIDQFPADRQAQIRVMLSESLRAVISQTLLRRDGGGRVAAHEILFATSSVRALIREGKTFQIESQMQTGRNVGMQTLNGHLVELVKSGVVDAHEAYRKAVDKTGLEDAFQRNGINLS